MRNPVDVKFPDERVAQIVADRLAQAPFDIVPAYSEQLTFPTIRVTHVAKNLQSNDLVVEGYEGHPCRLNNYVKKKVPDENKFYQFSLVKGFALQYFPPSFDDTGRRRMWLQTWFDPNVLTPRAPYFWFPSNIAVEDLFEVRQTRQIIELVPSEKRVLPIHRKIAV